MFRSQTRNHRKRILRRGVRPAVPGFRDLPGRTPRTFLRIAVAAGFLPLLPAPATAGGPLAEALKGGKVTLDLRYRFEEVHEEGFRQSAGASTLRLRLGYGTGTFHDLFAHADLEHILVIGTERYDSTSNGFTTFPVVADPEDTEVNQAYLGFRGVPDTVFQLGRQRITLDNHRFIGNVGWRQNEQTFDAFSVRSGFTEDISFFYAHINNANRIFGENHPVAAKADQNLFADLANLSYRFPAGTITAYAYLIETEDAPGSSHKDIGLRFSGSHALSDRVRLLYTLEYADQSDYRDGTDTNDASYGFAELGVGRKDLTIKIGHEILGGDGTYGFSTPLATLHAHNGWADLFLTTPPAGLKDLSLSVETSVAGIRLLGTYHGFSADAGGADYGGELDLLATRSFQNMYSVGVKYASYRAETFLRDTEKLWITLQMRF